MKKSLAHLPKQKQTELMLITEKIGEIVPEAEMIFLFGSYARGDWKDGPHVQGRGRLTIRKRSDYDIFVVTRFAYTTIARWTFRIVACTPAVDAVTAVAFKANA